MPTDKNPATRDPRIFFEAVYISQFIGIVIPFIYIASFAFFYLKKNKYADDSVLSSHMGFISKTYIYGASLYITGIILPFLKVSPIYVIVFMVSAILLVFARSTWGMLCVMRNRNTSLRG